MDRKLQGLQKAAKHTDNCKTYTQLHNIQKNARFTDKCKTYRTVKGAQKTAKHTDECKVYRQQEDVQTAAKYKTFKESFSFRMIYWYIKLVRFWVKFIISICRYVSKFSLLLALPILFIGNFPESLQSSSHPNNIYAHKIDYNNIHTPKLIFFLQFFPNRFCRDLSFFPMLSKSPAKVTTLS